MTELRGHAAFGRPQSRLRSNDLPNVTPTRKQKGPHGYWTQNPHPNHQATGSQLGLIPPEEAPGNVWGANVEGAGARGAAPPPTENDLGPVTAVTG